MFTARIQWLFGLISILLMAPIVWTATTTEAPPNVETSSTQIPNIVGPFSELLGPMMDTFAQQVGDGMKMINARGFTVTKPPVAITTTTTRRPTIIKGLGGGLIPGTQLLTAPGKVLDSILLGSTRKGPLETTAERLVEATKFSGKLLGTLTGVPAARDKPEDESVYYEYDYDPLARRVPKYFSKECQFRVACEAGKAMRAFSPPDIRKVVETNKTIQDMQSRYTRAMTYGMLYNDCERYYCLFVRFLGGPKELAGGVADLVNRLANPDMYE